MRRSLVLTDEAARHPFRASLPPHVTATEAGDMAQDRPGWRARLGLTGDDMRGFMNSYCACLVATGLFIA